MENHIEINTEANPTQKQVANISMILYFIMMIFSPISILIIRPKLIVYGDAETTVSNIMASKSLFKISIIADLINITVFLLLVVALYKLFKPVKRNISSLMVIFVVVCAPIMYINLLNNFAVLHLLSNEVYLNEFGSGELNALIMLFLNLFDYGYSISQIFHALWLFPLGYLVYKSGYFPKFLGIWLVIGGFGYLIDTSMMLFFPGNAYTIILYLIVWLASISEIAFVLWLLIKGVKLPESKNHSDKIVVKMTRTSEKKKRKESSKPEIGGLK